MNLPDWLKGAAIGGHSPDLLTTLLSVGVTFVLAVGIAWLHRLTARGNGHTQDYSHTLIIIAVVTTALIVVVSGSMAIGVAMFAAFSMIRFPQALGRSTDLAFAFFAIAVGMVSGAGRHGTATIITVAIGALMYYLHTRNAFSPARATHLLTVSLGSDEDPKGVLEEVFSEHTDDNRLLRTIPSPDGGRIDFRYGLSLKQGTSVARFVEALHHACGNQRIVLIPAEQDFEIER